MILAATNITIDGVFVAAFFTGLVALVSALVAGYIKLRSIGIKVDGNSEKAQDRIAQLHKDVASLVVQQGRARTVAKELARNAGPTKSSRKPVKMKPKTVRKKSKPRA